jgi:hypothetical protein
MARAWPRYGVGQYDRQDLEGEVPPGGGHLSVVKLWLGNGFSSESSPYPDNIIVYMIVIP